jgi:fructokinase
MILVAGEALIDMLPLERDGLALFRPVPGGSPFNVALALGRLGIPVRFLCPLSRDAFGDLLGRTLRDSGVDVSLCPLTDALSTLGFVTLDPIHRSARYAFYTEATAGCLLEAGQTPVPLPPAVTCVHLGSFSLAVEPFGSAAERLADATRGRCLLSLDPNIRPFLVRDRGRYVARLERLAGLADLMKLSAEDLEWWQPGVAAAEVARERVARGVKLCVVTHGGEGAEAWSRRSHVRVEAPAVQVVDTVGAGDTFQAALLAWLHRKGNLQAAALADLGEADLREMLHCATRAAAITCGRAGCNPPWAREFWDLPKPLDSGN